MSARANANSHVRPILTTFAYYIVFIALGLTTAVAGPSLPWLAEQTRSRIDQISLIFVASSLGYMIGSLISARGYERFPGHHIQSAMLLLMAATAAMMPVVPWLWPLLILFFLLGMGQSGVDVGCNTLVVWLHGKKVGPIMNGLHFFVGIGFLLAPIVFAQVVGVTGSIRWVYWSFGLLILPIAAWLWKLPSPSIQVESSANRVGRAPPLLMGLFVAFFVFYVGGEVGYGNWIFTYATKLNLANEAAAAYLTSAYWGSLTLGRLLAIGISTRLRPSTILYMSLLGCLVSVGVILLWPTSIAMLWIGTVALGLSTASDIPHDSGSCCGTHACH